MQLVDILLLDGTTNNDMADRVKNAYDTLAKSGSDRTRYADFFFKMHNWAKGLRIKIMPKC